MYGKQVAEDLPEDKPSISIFPLFPFNSFPLPHQFSSVSQALSLCHIFSELCTQFAVTPPLPLSWLKWL